MFTEKKAKTAWDDVLFENRNKAYGAYELRMNYDRRLTKSLLFMLLGLTALFFIPLAISKIFFREEIVRTMPNNDRLFVSDNFYVDIPAPKVIPPELNHRTIQPKPPVDENAFKPVVNVPAPKIEPISPAIGSGTGTASPTQPLIGSPTGIATNPPPQIIDKPLNIASVDVQPDFPGGLFKFYEFLKNHLRYTPQARAAGLNGRYYVTFIVNENGTISDVEMMKSIGYGQDEEVQKVLASSPAWKPGISQTRPVRTQMVLPISFNLLQ